MKKLGKKLQFSANTIESFYECYCRCSCDCGCFGHDMYTDNQSAPSRSTFSGISSGPGPF